VQQISAMEYRPTPALHSAMPAGAKVAVHDAAVRRGMLLLTPQNCSVLGGQVAALEQARQRMVAHWSQPAGGRQGEWSMRIGELDRPPPPALPRQLPAACLLPS
jgi:hypothetical protein